jgi:hypothetical protein
MRIGILSAAGGLIISTSSAMAGPTEPPPAPPPAESPWEFRLEPYGWLSGISGTTGILGREIPTDLGVNQLFQHLKMSYAGELEVRYYRFGLMADIFYADIGGYLPTPFGRIQQFAADDKMVIFQVVPNYRVFKSDKGFFDLVAGLRGWDMKLRLTGFRQPGIIINGGYFNNSQSKSWVDGIGGVRGQYFLVGNTFVAAYGDIGGGSSKLTWQVQGTLGYRFSRLISAEAGWRLLSDNYQEGGFTYNVKQQGTFIGVSFTW